MKKIINFLILAILLIGLSGCNHNDKQEKQQEEQQEEQMDCINTSRIYTDGYEQNQQNSLLFNFSAVNGGCYMIKHCNIVDDAGGGMGTETFVYFTENVADGFVPLCGKPDCRHNSRNCNAHIGGLQITLYDNKIYYPNKMGPDTDIYCMELDGTGHRKITEGTELTGDCIAEVNFDSNYFYFSVHYDSGELLLGRIEISSNAEPEYYDVSGMAFIHNITPVDGVIYVEGSSANNVKSIYRCVQGESPQIILEDFDSISGTFFEKDRVHLFREGENIINGFYEWSLDAGEEILAKEMNFESPYVTVVYDDEYIYVEEIIPSQKEDYYALPKFYVFNEKYELIDSVNIPYDNPTGIASFIIATDDQIFFSSKIWPESVEYYINKSDIANELHFNKIIIESEDINENAYWD